MQGAACEGWGKWEVLSAYPEQTTQCVERRQTILRKPPKLTSSHTINHPRHMCHESPTHTHTHRYTRGKCNKALLCARPFSSCSRSSPYSTSPPPTRNIRSRLRNFVSCSPCVVHFWKGGKWVEMWEGIGDLPRCKHHHIHYYDSCCHN